MNKIITLLVLASLSLSCDSNNQKEKELMLKENDLLKRELEIQKRESQQPIQKAGTSNKDYTEKKINQLKNLLNTNGWEIVKMDSHGKFSFDMGSASAGRVLGNFKDVLISIEHMPERPGCADICPPMEIIHFNCKNGEKCISDPANPRGYGTYSSGSISFQNIKNGKETYKLLSEIQKSLK